MVQIKEPMSAAVIISFMNVQMCYFMVCQLLTFRYFRHADEHDQLMSLRCLCCKVNVAQITVLWFCASMNIACFG